MDFDAVVVGSGFGGSVTAYKLAEAGWKVCLLERGKAYPPGSFPRSPRDMARNFWDPSQGLHGMFDVWTFTGLEALVGSGLGGGSLIYANVLLRKDERWFVGDDTGRGPSEHWPVTREELDTHYEAAEEMLQPQRYPFGAPPYSSTPKTLALQHAAGALGMDWQLPPLAVTFANRGQDPIPGVPIEEPENLHGRPRYTCTLCGECDIGCNYGSKNTLDFNYLSRFRGTVETRAEVRAIEPLRSGGFAVGYVRHEPDREGRRTLTSRLPMTTITSRRLVLSAGALGTTYLLLRNRSAFPRISKALGTRFCGNGDLLGFVVGAREIGHEGLHPRPLDPAFGPVITSAIRIPDAADPGGDGRGFYVEDGGHPQFVSWMVEAAHIPNVLYRAARFGYRLARNALSDRPISNISAEVGHLLGDGSASSARLPLLGMGRDVPDGVMRLRGRYLEVDWTTRTSRAYFARVRGAMAAIARSLGARFIDNPVWYLRRVITVHPLGGCPMGRTPEEGVVDPHGQVFGYPGLFIADGSVMPGPVGANPALTIAALADRSASRILEEG